MLNDSVQFFPAGETSYRNSIDDKKSARYIGIFLIIVLFFFIFLWVSIANCIDTAQHASQLPASIQNSISNIPSDTTGYIEGTYRDIRVATCFDSVQFFFFKLISFILIGTLYLFLWIVRKENRHYALIQSFVIATYWAILLAFKVSFYIMLALAFFNLQPRILNSNGFNRFLLVFSMLVLQASITAYFINFLLVIIR